jgi:hypothetical protein
LNIQFFVPGIELRIAQGCKDQQSCKGESGREFLGTGKFDQRMGRMRRT